MQNEVKIRLISFVVIFLVVALGEIMFPRRRLRDAKARRWRHNLGLIFLDNLVLWLLLSGATIAVAVVAEQSQWGLLHYYHVPGFLAVIIGVLVLDLIIYLQHLMFHAVPLLWRLHMVHHTDLDIDVTTGLRFHPLEIIISVWIKLAAIMVLGVPAAGHEQMAIGLAPYRDARELTFTKLLKLPFSGNPGRYSLDHIGREPSVKK